MIEEGIAAEAAAWRQRADGMRDEAAMLPEPQFASSRAVTEEIRAGLLECAALAEERARRLEADHA